MLKKQKVIVLVGPTSSGKSALAVLLARRFNGEVISADSRQVYRGLNIGTGKITKREMKSVRHHLLDVVSPKHTFTAHNFVVQGQRAIETIAMRGKLPIIVGGTGFYVDALVGRVVLPNVPINQKLRALLEKKTAAALYAMLKKRDPRRAKTIDPQNKHRLIRALEIASAIGFVPKSTESSLYNVLWVGLALPKKQLEQKIASRLSAHMRQGMVAEAKYLHEKGLSYRRMEAMGLEYRSLARLLQKKILRQEFEKELLRDIRHYAKRQMTYWKRNKEIQWSTPNAKQTVLQAIRRWLSA